MKKILLCTDGSLYSQVSYEYAVWIATGMEVEIEILYVTDVRKKQVTGTPDFSGSIGIDAYQQLLNQLVTIEEERAKFNHQRAKIILQEAKRFFSERNIQPIKLTHETGFLVDSFHKFEGNCDLIILGKRGETAKFATEHLGANLERIVRSSHKPCLVTPKEFQPVTRLLLAYDGGKSCQKALEYLANLPIFQDLELHLVTIANRNEAEALKNLQTAEAKLRAKGLNPQIQLLSGEPEESLTKYLEDYSINFLVMGAYGHSRIRRLVIGSTTAQMLRSSHIPVLLFR